VKVSFKPVVASDLLEIASFIADDNPERARTFVAELLDKCSIIARRPKAGRLRPEIGEGVRSRAYRGYVILYRIEPERVRVLRIVHGARDIEHLPV